MQERPRPQRHDASIQFEWLGDPHIIERKDEVIPGLLGASEIAVIHADTKVGKSQFATDLSFALATGARWFGLNLQRSAVLYLAVEKGRVTKRRFRALQRLHGGIRPPIAVSTAPLDLMTKKNIDGVIAAAAEMKTSGLSVRLIVIDTLNRAMAGIDENAAGPVGQAFNGLTRIAEETGAGIIVLHHNAKGSGAMRGSSVIAASADLVTRTISSVNSFSIPRVAL